MIQQIKFSSYNRCHTVLVNGIRNKNKSGNKMFETDQIVGKLG